jgi:drug/metabolite transporter (DMT)-like permease
MNAASKPPALSVALALGAVYLVWGSTYLAIRFAIETIPPFTMAGVRFTVAGWLLYALVRLRGAPAPTRRHWGSAAIIGALLLGMGNGGVTWAEQLVPSGIAALIVATVPAWMVLFEWIRPDGTRPTLRVVLGLALGLAGIGLLVVAGQADFSAARIDLRGAGALLLAALSWAYGSIRSRSLDVPSSALQLTAMQMIAGGLLLLGVGVVTGEPARLEVAAVTRDSILALAYLIVFGAWVGYGAYVWLLRATTPAVVSTYAYVNPGIAVFLGWLVADEPLDGWMLGAMGVTLVGVALITFPKRKARAGHPTAASGDGRAPARSVT